MEDDLLRPMDEALAASGPDDAGFRCEGPVGLGQRLLRTTPESKFERLPLVGPNGSCMLVADARLDNRTELAHALGIGSSQLVTVPDSALILAAYEKWGNCCPAHFIGDFSFVLWDQRTRALFCARDQLGIRPFYYCYLPGRFFAFASQLAGLVAHPQVPKRLDELALGLFLAQHMNDRTITLFADCRRLPPAHTLRIQGGHLQVQRYWSPEPVREVRLSTDDDYADACRELLKQAVRDRTRTEARVGVHITGGLDSSAVACLAADLLHEAGQDVSGFTWSSRPTTDDDPSEGELPFIASVCSRAGLTRHCPEITVHSVLDVLLSKKGPLGHLPIPASEMAMHELMQGQGVGVVLTGWGGDQVASSTGRGQWAALAQQGRWNDLVSEVYWRRRRAGESPRHMLLKSIIPPLLPDPLWNVYRRLVVETPFTRPSKMFHIQPAFIQRLQLAEFLRQSSIRLRPGVRSSQLQLLEHGQTVGRMEDWSADAARWGLEYRHPMLDLRLVNFCLALPPEQYLRNGWTRYLFRRVVHGIVPQAVAWQRGKADPVNQRHADERRGQLWPTLREPLEQYGGQPEICSFLDVPTMQRQLDILCATTEPPPGTAIFRALPILVGMTAASFVERHNLISD